MANVILSDVIDIISGGTPKTSESKYWSGGNIDWLSINDFNNGNRFVYSSEKKITELALKESNIKLLNKGDVIISARGTVGVLAQIGKPMCFNQSCFGLRGKKELIDNDFLYYVLKNYIHNLKKKSQGSVFDTINIKSFDLMEIDIPNYASQCDIASVLSVLDQKIELNNRINAELEAMAKTLYDYWFVQFDFPNEEGKPYKSSGGKMVYNTTLKQEIPDGWVDKQLNSVVERIGTGLNPRDNFKLGEGNNYYITIKDIEQGRIIFSDKTDRVSDVTLDIINKRSDIKVGDILFTSIQPVGLTYLIHEKPVNWNINESVFTIRANQSLVTSEYLFKLLSSEQMKVFSKNSSSGSIHKGIRHGVLKTFVFAYANLSLINKFTEMITPLLQKQYKLEIENNNLQSLRDFLLPMLMNGQVTVK